EAFKVQQSESNQRARARPAAPGSEAAGENGTALRALGIVVGSAGLVGIGVGSYFGLSARSKRDDARESCTGRVCATEESAARMREASHDGTASTIAFAIGAAALGTGIVLY